MEHLWLEDEYGERPHPVIDKQIHEAEKQLNIKLPEAYIRLLKIQNGGYISINAFPTTTPNSWADDHVHIEKIFGIKPNEGILATPYLIEEWGLPESIVLFAGDGHGWFAFDYRHTKTDPSIIYLDVEQELTIELTANFESFLAGLYEYEESEEIEVEDQGDYSPQGLELAILTNDLDSLILNLNHVYETQKDHDPNIYENITLLLKHKDDNFRDIGALYTQHFYDKRLFTQEEINQLIIIIKADKQLAPYAVTLSKKKRSC
ncbi:SMI1/KNR4 family protein [Alkalihalobacillus pseudalcaliphilus]|uniref:SMI1/KNR4 family protein n=1 Tax=Alkalihalobacillus pseudalcaliphilus TaxID=79884 RepID=UPI000840B154